MKMKLKALFLFSLTLLLLAGTAQTFAQPEPFTFDLYETTDNTATGPACEACLPTGLPGVPTFGWVILMESGDPTNTIDQANTLLWGDAVHIFTVHELPAIQIFSDGCTAGIDSGDVSCFPTYAEVISAPSHAFISETAPPTVYVDTLGNQYSIFSDAPEAAAVAEPGSLLLLGSGLAGLGAFARRIRQRV
jgi:hypothetical protein